MEYSQASFQKHNRLLQQLEDRFQFIRMKYADRMTCSRGCARCCHGLFDIPLPDAMRVAEGLHGLSEQTKAAVAERAAAIQKLLTCELKDFRPPYLLDSIPEQEIDAAVAHIGNVRCPFLDEHNSCLIYRNRPLACLLEGIPMVDAQDGLFGDWCELNFESGVSPEIAADLLWDYYEIQEIEGSSTIFIPSVIAGSADVPPRAPGFKV